MKLLRGRVDWMEGRGNRPILYLLLQDVPSDDDMRFEQRGDLYFAERDGFCSFFSWRGVPDRGFGGHGFGITMTTGEKKVLQGPWSSRSDVMNDAGFGPCMDVVYSDNVKDFTCGQGRGGAVLVSLLRDNALVIDIGEGYTWRPGSTYAAEVAFPAGSTFSLACSGYVSEHRKNDRFRDFVSVPELYPDGMRIDRLRSAILAAQAAGQHELAHEIAARYTRYRRVGALESLVALSGYEPAVKLSNGEFWTKPD